MLSGAMVLSFALPARAQALTKQVYEGLPPTPQKKFIDPKYNTDAIDFFPHTATIHVGDSIKFSATAFHNVDIPAKGKKPGRPAGSDGYERQRLRRRGRRALLVQRAAELRLQPGAHQRRSAGQLRPVQDGQGQGQLLHVHGQEGGRHPDPVRRQPQAPDGQVHQGRDGQVLLRPAPRDGGRRQGPAEVQEDPEREGRRQGAEGADRPRLQDRQDAQGPEAAGQHDQHRQRGQVRRRVLQLPARDDNGDVGTTIKFQITPLSYESHTATTGPSEPIDEPHQLPGASSRRRSSPSQFLPEGIYPSDPFGTVGTLTPHLARQRVLELRSAGQRRSRRRSRRRTR